MSGIWLPGSALTINLFLIIIFFVKKNVENNEVKIYRSLIIAGFLFSLNALSVYIISKTIGTEAIVGFFQRIHLSLLSIIVFLLLTYNITMSNSSKTILKIFNTFNTIYTVITISLIFILPIEVINYDEILDVGGYSYYAAIIQVILYFFIFVIINIKYLLDNKHNFKKCIPFIILIFMFIIGLLLRLHYPEIITETYCVAFALLVMYFTIENPDVKLLEQVSLAKEQAEKANAAKTDFLSSMSHEIRTPLNAIVGFSEAIQDEDTLEAAKQDAKDIILASQNLLELVNGILDISKLEANKMEIINTEYDLRTEIENLIKLIKPRIGEKPIELNLTIAHDIPKTLYGDKSKIKEILSNLLTNAAKYTEKGHIDVNISCINKNDECSLMISVEDTGRGIKPEKIDKLFCKFERLDEDRNTTIEGVGLGLAITKRLVELMNGKIVVQSVFGSSTKFTFYIKQKISKNVSNPVVNQTSSKLVLDGKKVLIVDDNELNLKIAERMLNNYNITVEKCNSGLECLELIKKGKTYDLILMDDMMPKMSGTETLHVLQENPSFNIKVVVLTANAIEGMKDKYIENGFNDYISKPIERNELERILRKYLTKEVVHNNFEPLPDKMFEIADSIVEKLNKEE